MDSNFALIIRGSARTQALSLTDATSPSELVSDSKSGVVHIIEQRYNEMLWVGGIVLLKTTIIVYSSAGYDCNVPCVSRGPGSRLLSINLKLGNENEPRSVAHTST